MGTAEITIEQIVNLALALKKSERVRLITRLVEMMSNSMDTPVASQAVGARNSPLRGALAHLGPAPSAEQIDNVRREMWSEFPREDI
jgi:hypothetical protein